MPKKEGAEAIRMRSMWCESDQDGAYLSILLALALPPEQRPKLSFLTFSASSLFLHCFLQLALSFVDACFLQMPALSYNLPCLF